VSQSHLSTLRWLHIAVINYIIHDNQWYVIIDTDPCAAVVHLKVVVVLVGHMQSLRARAAEVNANYAPINNSAFWWTKIFTTKQ
jgi:hypothetical protein